MKKFLILFGLLIATIAGAVTLPYTFSTSLPPSQINANFSALRDAINNHESLTNGHNTDLEDVLTINPSVGAQFINFNLTELNLARFQNLATPPTCNAGSLGRVIWDTTAGTVKVCNGTSFVLVPSGSVLNFNFASEVPSGVINGVNVTFTIANTPISGSFKLYRDGLRLRAPTDYSISGTTITMVSAPVFGQRLDCDYAY